MMQRLISKREKVILVVTAAVILSSGVFTFFLSPFLKRTDILNREIRRARLKLKKYAYLLSQESQLKERYEQFLSRQRLPDAAENPAVSVLSILENLAKEANIRIVDIRPQGPRASQPIGETSIDLRTEGTMEGYLKFLYSIENSLVLLDIQRFQLNAKPSSQLLEGSFTISQVSLSE